MAKKGATEGDPRQHHPFTALVLERYFASKIYQVARHRDFRLMWIGAFLSFCGSWIESIAQGYLVYQLTHDKFLLGLVMFASTVPVTLFGPVAGTLADMVDKRKLLVITQGTFAAGSLFLAVATYMHFVQYWHIVTVALILGTVNTIDMPARQSIVSRVVPPEDLPAAIPINALTFNFARIVGPAIGGILMVAAGPQACYLVNGLSFFALIFAGLAIRADLKATKSGPQPIKDLILEGALYTFRESRLRALFILEAVISMFGLFYTAQMPAIANDMLADHSLPKAAFDAQTAKILSTCYVFVGLGAVVALVFIMSASHLKIKSTILRVATTGIGLCLVLLSFARVPAVAYLIFIFLGMAAITIFNTANTLFQMLSPERLRGRVLSMHIWALNGLGPIGIFAFGYFAEHGGLPRALLTGGLVVCLAALWGWLDRKDFEGNRPELEVAI